MKVSDLYGRLVNHIGDDLKSNLSVNEFPAIELNKNYILCNRCLQKTKLNQARLPNGRYYCRFCILLGRLTNVDILYNIEETNEFKRKKNYLKVKLDLSKQQKICSDKLHDLFLKKKNCMLWAVTGAGKTEMLFKTIECALKRKERICIASPRIDVCNELYPRLKKSFDVDITLLYGKQQENYRYTQLVICTTHQLLKFKEAFDLMIIDEVDAYPLNGNKMLTDALKKACKKNAVKVYLTATPSKKLLEDVKKNKLQAIYLPLRFHQKPLVKPKLIFYGKNLFNLKFVKILEQFENSSQPFLIFVPKINHLQIVYSKLNKILKKSSGATVYAHDNERIQKIQNLRDKKYDYLVTTTILERGVTFKGLNVLVLNADDHKFSTESLIQIAGRVGRSIDCPTGDVYFMCKNYTKQVNQAIKTIEFMNRKAKKLIDE